MASMAYRKASVLVGAVPFGARNIGMTCLIHGLLSSRMTRMERE